MMIDTEATFEAWARSGGLSLAKLDYGYCHNDTSGARMAWDHQAQRIVELETENTRLEARLAEVEGRALDNP